MTAQFPTAILWAALPIAVLLTMLVGFRIKSAVAAPLSFAVAVATALLCFRARPAVLAAESAKGVWNAVVIFYVVFTAMLIYEALRAADMFSHIRAAMDTLLRDDLLRVLFVGWGFTSFLQGITGFGVPVAVAAPILVGMGIQVIPAVMICILGHAWGGTFGTLAIAFDSLLLQAGVAPENAGAIALYSCMMLWVYNFICGVAICAIYRKGLPRARDLFYVLCISAAQGGGQLLAVQVNPSVACFLASALSLAVIALLDRACSGAPPAHPAPGKKLPLGDIAAPYLFLTALVGLLLLPAVNAALSTVQIGPALPDGAGGRSLYSPISLFTHSGTLLLATGLFTYFHYRRRGLIAQPSLRACLRCTLQKSLRSILPILFLIMMSKVMDGAGHIGVLSAGAAALFGGMYPLASPFVGVLGSFASSSNMSSNILFAGFQKQAALLSGADVAVVLAAQTAGGSVGNLLATSNMVLGLATTGQPGREGEVLRGLLPVCLVCGAACSLLVWWLL